MVFKNCLVNKVIPIVLLWAGFNNGIKVSSNHTFDVIILGAGPSGLAAASKLIDHGITNFLILEAENRYGGRIYSAPFAGYQLDFGAQWCHGEEGNIVYELANPLNLLSHSEGNVDLPQYIYDLNGNLLNETLVLRLFEIMSSINGNEDVNNTKYAGSSQKDYVGDKYYQALNDPTNNGIPRKLADMIFELRGKLEGASTSLEDWSLEAYYSSYLSCKGDEYMNWKDKTYSIFLEVLMKTYQPNITKMTPKDKLLLNKEVTHILWNNNDLKQPIKIFCEDGSQYSANHVLITVSLGVLKHRSDTLFEPKLPEWKLNAIRNLNYGCNAKVYFRFPINWWEERNETSFMFALDESEKDELLSQFTGTKEENRWLLGVNDFHIVENKPEILEGWNYGPYARQMESVPDKEVQEKIIQLLRIYLKKKFSIPDPSHFIRTKWCLNKHFFGTYSWAGLSSIRANTSNAELAKTVYNDFGKPQLFFAGETTNPIHFSTVHGAVETGYREADNLARLIKHL